MVTINRIYGGNHMKALIDVLVLKKIVRESADKKTKYYSVHGYQDGEQEIVEIHCTAEQFAGYDEGKIARVHVSQRIITDNFTKEPKFFCKQLNNHAIKAETKAS